MRIPNTFIVGAPKCGTTALSRYLRAHPGVFITTPKEPNYFCEDIPNIREASSRDDYLRLYDEAQPEHAAVGEASSIYMYSMVAGRLISEFNPDARIIAMVRNPLEMVYSFHSQMCYNLAEPETDFERAWRLQDSHARHSLLRYGAIGMLGQQLRRLLDVFPRRQVKVIVFDDFRSRPDQSYRDVREFLGLPDDHRTEFPRFNANKSLRSERLERFVRRTPAPLAWIAERVKSTLGLSELGILDSLRRANRRTERRSPMPEGLRAELAAFFRDDVALLSDLLSRDLTHWTRASDTVAEVTPPGTMGDRLAR